MKSQHMWICGALVAVALAVVAFGGSAAILIPALGCALMMGGMMWMMMRMGSGRDRGPEQ
jgi:hypothetical protein